MKLLCNQGISLGNSNYTKASTSVNVLYRTRIKSSLQYVGLDYMKIKASVSFFTHIKKKKLKKEDLKLHLTLLLCDVTMSRHLI